MKYALAIDIGASSGRHILGWIEDGKIPETVAVDTWGVDYVLLDENEDIISPVWERMATILIW